MGERLTHVDDQGAARMVDISGKDVTVRTARASGRVLVSPEVVALLRGSGVPKGDVLGVARVAGIQGAKHTPDLVPLCHPLGLDSVAVELMDAEGSSAAKVRQRSGSPVEPDVVDLSARSTRSSPGQGPRPATLRAS